MRAAFNATINRPRSSMRIVDSSEMQVGGMYDVEGGCWHTVPHTLCSQMSFGCASCGSGVGLGQRTTCLHTVLGHAHLQVWSTVGQFSAKAHLQVRSTMGQFNTQAWIGFRFAGSVVFIHAQAAIVVRSLLALRTSHDRLGSLYRAKLLVLGSSTLICELVKQVLVGHVHLPNILLSSFPIQDCKYTCCHYFRWKICKSEIMGISNKSPKQEVVLAKIEKSLEISFILRIINPCYKKKRWSIIHFFLTRQK